MLYDVLLYSIGKISAGAAWLRIIVQALIIKDDDLIKVPTFRLYEYSSFISYTQQQELSQNSNHNLTRISQHVF